MLNKPFTVLKLFLIIAILESKVIKEKAKPVPVKKGMCINQHFPKQNIRK